VEVTVLPIPEFGLSSVSLKLSVKTLDELLGKNSDGTSAWEINTNTAYPVPGELYPSNLTEPATPTDAELTPPLVPAEGIAQPSASSASSYTVQSGDTANKIARKYNITLAALIAANPTTLGVNADALQPGQVLNIPTP
jgi:LysM repeat protein